MAVTINGTTGIAGVDGSASTPAVQGSDTNTGIFFPAADTIAFGEGGSEAMRIDSSGNVGIGTTSADGKLDVAAAMTNGSTGAFTTPHLALTATNTTDNTGFVGMTFATSNSANYGYSLGALRSTNAEGSLIFKYHQNDAAGTERARITSGGEFCVGTTSAISSSILSVLTSSTNTVGYFRNSNGSSPQGIIIEYTGTSPNGTGNLFINCGDSSNARFKVRSNGGIENYQANDVNLSDRREKTNFALAGNYLSKICAIPVQTFNYIDQSEDDPGLTLGVVAQDVEAVAPELVMESDWSTEKNGSKMRLSIYQTDLQYALMKSIQELKAITDAQATRIETLEAQNAAFEARLAALEAK